MTVEAVNFLPELIKCLNFVLARLLVMLLLLLLSLLLLSALSSRLFVLDLTQVHYRLRWPWSFSSICGFP